MNDGGNSEIVTNVGSSEELKCPNCGHLLQGDELFCPNCLQRLKDAPETEPSEERLTL